MPVHLDMHKINLLPYLHHYWDDNGHIPIPEVDKADDLRTSLISYNFKKIVNPGSEYVLGAANSNHWLRFCLSNQTNKSLDLVFAASPAITSEIDFYPQKINTPSFQTGNSRPMSTRDIHSREPHFNIELQANETQEFYVRIKTRTRAYIDARIWDKSNYAISKDILEGIDGIYVGILLGLILYTLLMYLSVRQSSTLIYIVWNTCNLVLLAAADGRILQYVLPNSPALAHLITVIFYPLCVFFTALFGEQFIRLKNHPRLYIVGRVVLTIFIILLISSYQYGELIYFKIWAFFCSFVIIYYGLICPLYLLIFKRSSLATYLLISQSPLIITALERSIFSAGLTKNLYVPYGIKFGFVTEMILLAYFIGLTIYKEKNEAQKLAFDQLKISNDLKSNYNVELEAEIARNTSEIRSMNTDLEQQAKKLIELDGVKSKFFANISHEFRTPLTLIQGPLTQLLTKQDQPYKDVIQGAIRHSKGLQTLIDQLLTLSKFDGQSLVLKASKVNASDLVRSMTSQFTSLTESKQLTLDFQTSVPKLDAYIDAEKLQIILNNLLNNAIKFTPAGGRIVVSLSSTADSNLSEDERVTDEYLQIDVIDSGHGIPQEEVNYVFDRFFQSSSSAVAGSGAGTGIGLALVKELTQLHVGEVNVSSKTESINAEPDRETGTTFSVRLPLGHAHLRRSEIVESQQERLTDNSTSESHINSDVNEGTLQFGFAETKPLKNEVSATVLVVDDNNDMRAYVRSLLEPEYQIVEAVDGLDAEQAVDQYSPDLIITDLMMPKRDGLQFVESLKKNDEFSKTPVIMLTAKAGAEDRLKGLLASVDDYLAKPFDALELKARVKNLLIKHAQFKTFYQNEMSGQSVVNNAEESETSYLAKVRSIVDQHLADPRFDVKALASEMHVSKATLLRRLSDKTEFTPSQFIRHCRLEKARQLSLDGNMRTMSELAHAVGFNQASYFSRLYQKTFNTMPLINSITD